MIMRRKSLLRARPLEPGQREAHWAEHSSAARGHQASQCRPISPWRGTIRHAAVASLNQPAAGGNERRAGSAVWSGRSCLVCLCDSACSQSALLRAPPSGPGRAASSTGPGAALCGPESSPSRSGMSQGTVKWFNVEKGPQATHLRAALDRAGQACSITKVKREPTHLVVSVHVMSVVTAIRRDGGRARCQRCHRDMASDRKVTAALDEPRPGHAVVA